MHIPNIIVFDSLMHVITNSKSSKNMKKIKKYETFITTFYYSVCTIDVMNSNVSLY